MKKLLCITLIALACLSAFGCTQEPSTTPNEVETATPEVTSDEIETITPNEVEVVIPNEPETPAEPEVPAEPDKNVIILPEADENTKYITIDFPADFPEEPYTQPDLVSPEEFEWGEYLPFVRYEADRFNKREFFEKHAFLTKDAKSLEGGNEIYERLNSKYVVEYEVPVRDILFGSGETYIESKNFDIKNVLFKSRIVYVSENADILGRFSLILPQEYYYTENLIDAVWNGKLEYIRNGQISNVENMLTVHNYTSGDRRKGWEHLLVGEDTWIKEEYADGQLEIASDNTAIFRINGGTDQYRIYSIDEKKAAYTLQINNTTSGDGDITVTEICDIRQIIDDRFLLLEFQKLYGTVDNFFTACYLYDIKTQDIKPLEVFASNAILSPDGKYLAYTDISPELSFFENGLLNAQRGFYIKNTENGSTTFFEYSSDGYFGSEYSVQGWVNEEFLKRVIEE